jgi:thymidylate synthase (FAD)
MAIEMLRLVRPLAPTIFREAGPGCLGGPCPEGTMTCGQLVEVRERFRNM